MITGKITVNRGHSVLDFLSGLSGIGGRVSRHKSGLETPPTRGIRASLDINRG